MRFCDDEEAAPHLDKRRNVVYQHLVSRNFNKQTVLRSNWLGVLSGSDSWNLADPNGILFLCFSVHESRFHDGIQPMQHAFAATSLLRKLQWVRP